MSWVAGSCQNCGGSYVRRAKGGGRRTRFCSNRCARTHWQRECRKRAHAINGERQCGRCHRWLPATIEHFVIRRDRKSGLNAWCRPCMRDYKRTTVPQDMTPEAKLVMLRTATLAALVGNPCVNCGHQTTVTGFCVNCGVMNARKAA